MLGLLTPTDPAWVETVEDNLDALLSDHAGIPESDEDVSSLRKACRRDHGTIPALLDRLLIHALIEARSCERFRLLSERLEPASLRPFYADLMRSEARHYRLFCRLAEELFGPEATRARLAVLVGREASVVERLPLGPTVHG